MSEWTSGLLNLYQWLMTTAFGMIAQILQQTPYAFSPTAHGVVQSISTVVTNFSFALLAFFFLTDLLGTTINFRVKKFEDVIPLILQLILGGVILRASFWICTTIFGLFASLVGDISGGVDMALMTEGIEEFVTNTQSLLDDLGFIENALVFLFTLIFLLSVFGMLLSCILVPITIMFEIYVYSAFAAIPLSSLLSSQKSIAINFIKAYAGVCLRGALILLGMLLATHVMNSPILRLDDPSASGVVVEGFALMLVPILQLSLNLMIFQKAVQSADKFSRSLVGG